MVNDKTCRILIRIWIRIHQSEAWIRGSVSTPTCHGSGTLHFGHLQIDADLDPVPGPDDHVDANLDADPDF